MGTRHLQTVINSKGVTKISQYGQWDGYPSGQGIDILNYLRGADIERYQRNLEEINHITDKQIEQVEQFYNWQDTFFYLSRDCGSRIHLMIEWGAVPFVIMHDEKEAREWCVGFYTIDFQKNTFTSEYYGTIKTYPLNELPTNEQYLLDMK